MQVSNIKQPLKALSNAPITWLIKAFTFLITGILLVVFIKNTPHFNSDYYHKFTLMKGDKIIFISLALLLFPLNWALEALKWKFLISKIEQISFEESIKGVLTGVSLGLITPHNLGDFAGRILHLNTYERFKGVGAILVSRLTQLWVTLLFGSVSLILFSFTFLNRINFYWLFFYIVIIKIILTCLILYRLRIYKWLKKISIIKKFIGYFTLVKAYSLKDLLQVLFLSFTRYMVFSAQFILLLKTFDIPGDILFLFLGVSFIFLFKSIIPTFFDFGVRETSAVYFFSNYGYNSQNVISASLTLWIINLVIPALIGLLLLFKVKLSTFFE